MKKGEIKKQSILETAESLFCHHGYESTSVQDILDELHTSKGSFYHHFVSKGAVLEEICRKRAVKSSGTVLQRASAEKDALAKINILFSGLIPVSGEKLSFLLMLLPVFALPEGKHIIDCYTETLSDLYEPAVASALKEGTDHNVFSCHDPLFSARISLLLINRCWLEICNLVLANETAGANTDPSDLLSMICCYRSTLERLLSAPCGSIDLIRLPELKSVIEQIRLHWNRS